MRRLWGYARFAVGLAFLAPVAQCLAQPAESDYLALSRQTFADVERLLISNDLERASTVFEQGIMQVQPSSRAYAELVLWHAALLTLRGKSYPAIKLLGDCNRMAAAYVNECRRAIQFYDQGNGIPLAAIVAGVRQEQSVSNKLVYVTPPLPGLLGTPLAEDDDEPPPRSSMSPSTAIVAGMLAGLSSVNGKAVAAPYASNLTQQQATAMREPPQRADHCVAIHPDPGSPAPQFHNTCNYAISISWCDEDPKSSSACRGGVNGAAGTDLNPGKSWPAGYAKVHFAACKGFANVLVILKDGVGQCR